MPLSNRSPDTTNELRHHRGVGRARSPRPRSLFQRPPHPRRRHGTGQTRTFVRHVRLVRRTRVSVLSGRPSAAWYRCPGGRVFQRGFSWQMSRSAWPLASHVRVMCPISRMTITPLACASLMARQNAFCRAACCWWHRRRRCAHRRLACRYWGAASPSEKIARVNIVAQVRDEVKRRGRIKSLEIKPESSAQAALHCSLCPADADCNGGTFRPLPRVGYGQNKAPYALNIRGPEIRTRVLSRGCV